MTEEFLLSKPSDDQWALEGRIHFGNVQKIYQEGVLAFSGEPTVLVNLKAVKASDSSGLALLVAWIRHARKNHQSFNLSQVPSFMYHYSRVCGVDGILPIVKQDTAEHG